MERYKIHPDGAVYFVTYSVIDWLPVFVSGKACEIIMESLKYCHINKHLRINAYVIMPTHMHAIIFDDQFDSKRLSATLTDFRKYTGRQLADFCSAHLPACFVETFVKASGKDRKRRFWQKTRHPVVFETENFWRQKIDYIHDNPCRKGLVLRAEYWRYSSASYLLSDGKSPAELPLSSIIW